MVTENSVRERIILLKSELGWTENSLAKGNPATQKRLNRQISHEGTITLDTVGLILDQFPDLSAEWLLRGTGDMMKEPAIVDDAQRVIYDLSIEVRRLKDRIAELENKRGAAREVVAG